jgi:hypothetical protein
LGLGKSLGATAGQASSGTWQGIWKSPPVFETDHQVTAVTILDMNTHEPTHDANVAPTSPDEAGVGAGHRGRSRGINSMEILFFIGFLAIWFALQLWILPRFGVST